LAWMRGHLMAHKDVNLGDNMTHVEIRTSRTAAALFLLVLAILLAPVGIIFSQVWAQMTAYSGPGVLVISPDPISDAVAATPAEFRVDESGAATYSVPIFVVPGTAGVAPQLSLNYSSQGGYGPMGRGWSVSGLSAISRCRATREAGDFLAAATPDGNPRPINFSASDRFCLDGQRLVPSVATCPNVGGMSASPLATEIESFQRVCAYTPAGSENGPAFFTAERKDGSISWYGDRDQNASSNRPDGYFESTAPGQTGKALSWAQTRFQDSTGNYIDYLYLENSGGAVGEHLISEVRYTGKVALAGQSAPASGPFARVVFNYSARATQLWGKGYVSGGLLTQSRKLDSITSCATIACETFSQVRHYVLGYLNSPSGSGLETLVSLRECRDNRTDAVCASATTFEWSTAPHNFASSESPSSSTLTTDPYHDFKLADINGDGRQDLALLYTAGSGCVGGSWVVSMLGTFDGAGRPTFASTIYNCVPTNIVNRGSGAWHLFDYNGDGLDDLFVSGANGAGWRMHPSNGTHFDMTTNLISGLSIPSRTDRLDQVQLADLNGDGLTDIVYPTGAGLKARLMVRQSGGAFAWDAAERSVVIDEASLPPMPMGCGDQWNPDVRNCQRVISGMPTTKAGFTQLADLNGDAASDLLLRITTSADYRQPGVPGCTNEPLGAPSYPGGADGVVEGYWNDDSWVTIGAPFDPCWTTVTNDALHALVVAGLTSTSVNLSNHGTFSVGNPESVVFGDVNGDGLTDAFLRNTASSDWYSVVNTGTGFVAGTSLPLSSYRDQVRFADVNGDGRTDMLHVVNGANKVYYVRYALPSGGYGPSTPLPGGNARICQGSGCNEQARVPIFADFDGDGNLDFLSFNASSSNLGLYFSRGSQRFVPRDTIVSFTNGLGSRTELAYATLTNTAAYRRSNTSRNGTNWGRGAPVSDLLAPMYVVVRASSSSPQAGNPNAMASVHYRYANGRVQAGGRGFLGFGTIETIDPNQSGGYVVTKTTYSQNFPFIGMPMQTTKRVVNGTYSALPCVTSTINNTCFGVPGQAHTDLGGSWFSDNWQSWEVAPASLASLEPLHVRTIGSEERLRDPFTGEQTSRVVTAFNYGSHGNVIQTAVDTYTRSETTPSSTVITVNSYADDVGKWRLGRLTSSTVTHRRPSQADVVRTTGFSYEMSGATTGLLTEERVQPGGAANLASTKTYQLDDYGNRLQTTTCAGPATPCSTSGFQFRPVTATQVRRYARVTYDERGRFPTGTWEPFWTETGGEERQTSRIYERNVFGDPTSVYDANNVHSYAVEGLLGRPYYAWRQTVQFTSPGQGGLRTLTTYRTCAQVDCPTGAAFRQQVETTAAPRQWTYFDVLGRPVMQAAETFNAGVTGEDMAATCTDYTVAGQPRRVSNPFFLTGTAGLSGPASIANVCTAAARKWTTTTYDALGRPTQVVGPDSSQASVAYVGLATTKTDPRNNQTIERRNGLGELVSVTDAAGLTMIYNYFADGTVGSVMRDAGAGTIANYFSYDVLGRKAQQQDPDTGLTTFEYNALGELTAQVDAAGNRIEHALDARGRIWRTVVKDANGLTETESTFTFDLGTGALGQRTAETITGTYVGWSGQPGTAHDYRRDYNFDVMGRPTSSVVQVDGQVFGDGVAYDILGRPWQAMDASGKGVKTEFGPRGHARALCSISVFNEDPICPGADTVQRTLQVDAWGNVARERRGDSAALEVARTVWADTGRIASICAGNSSCNLVNEQYGWDAAGNLTSHLKEQRYLEGFTYDSLNRLSTGALLMRDGVTVNQETVSLGYDGLGNICSRGNSEYTYGGAAGCLRSGSGGSHAVKQLTLGDNTTFYTYDQRGNQIHREARGTERDRTIHYSFDDKAHEILMGSGQRVRFWYGPDGQRYKREEGGKVTYYFGSVEVVVLGGVTTFKRYVGGIALQAVVNGVVQSTKYLFHDHLGSLVRITNADGSVAERLDYQAFGARRNPSDPHDAFALASVYTPRGYTGHEYVDDTDVIHMNGRIYDSELGRFLQADPLIQAPNNTQSWNAYTYVFNNPFAYTDPTGMFSFRQLFAVVFAAVYAYFTWDLTGATAIYAAMIGGAITGAIATGTWKGAIMGAFTGAVTAGIGWAANTYEWGNMARIAAQATSGGIMESLQGGNFGNGFFAAGLTAAVMPNLKGIRSDVARAATGALIGGTISKATGGKFANGAISGAIQAAMAGRSSEGEDRAGDRQRGAKWSAGKVKDLLSESEVGSAFLAELQASEVELMSFEGASDTFPKPGGKAVVRDLSETLQGNYKDGVIRLNAGLTNRQAALSLYHEYQHHLGFNEVDARIRTEQFAIDAGFSASSPGYRTSAGTVNVQFIRSELQPGGSLSSHYNAGPRIRKYWGERSVPF